MKFLKILLPKKLYQLLEGEMYREAILKALPLSDDPEIKAIPRIITVMVFLLFLTAIAHILIQRQSDHWQQGLKGQWTVQVLREDGETTAERQQRTQSVLALLNQTPNITHAKLIEREDFVKLLEEWFGASVAGRDLPLPNVIEIELDINNPPDISALKNQMAQAGGRIVLDTHKIWLERLITLSKTLNIIAFIIYSFILIAAMTIVGIAVRSGLYRNKDTIELLHLIGAENQMIHRHFKHATIRVGLKGIFFGFLLAFITVLILMTALLAIDQIITSILTIDVKELAIILAPSISLLILISWDTRRAVNKTLSNFGL